MLENSLLERHWSFTLGKHIQYLVDIPSCGRMLISGWTTSPVWNHIVPNSPTGSPTSSSFVSYCEKMMTLAGRKPCFYIPDIADYSLMKATILFHGYFPVFNDYWMMYSTDTVDSGNEYVDVKKLNTEDFGEIERYVNAYKAGFEHLPTGYEYQLFLSITGSRSYTSEQYYAVLGNEIVGIVSCYSDHEFCGVYNLVVIPSHRKRGVGRTLLQTLLKKAAANGHRSVFLQCDEDTRGFYLKLGFSQIFKAEIYSRRE